MSPLLVGAEDPLHYVRHFGPPRGIVRETESGQLHVRRLGAGVRVLAAHPDGELGVLGMVDLHGRAGPEAGPTADALGLVDDQRGFAVHRRRADRRRGTARHYLGPLADVVEDVVVDPGRARVLDDDGQVVLPPAVYLAAGGGKPNPVRHLLALELVDQLVHEGLHDARSVRRRNVAVEPTLSVRDRRDGISRCAHRVPDLLQVRDERIHVGGVRDQELHVVPDGEAKMPFAVPVREIAEPPDAVHGHLPRRARPDGVERVPALGHVLEDARPGPLVVLPLPVVLDGQRVKELHRVRRTGLDRLPCCCLSLCGHCCSPSLKSDGRDGERTRFIND